MSVRRGDELSLLACVTGLAMIAVWAALLAMHDTVPVQLPMLIAAVAGFEIAMCGYDLWRRRAGGW